jgi:hypothetical protein
VLYMVIEQFRTAGGLEIYRRARDRGRLMPEGLKYVASWVSLDFTTCFQLMQTDDAILLDEWTNRWQDLVDFEITPIQTSAEAMQAIAQRL